MVAEPDRRALCLAIFPVDDPLVNKLCRKVQSNAIGEYSPSGCTRR